MSNKHESLELSIKANCMRILEILENQNLDDLGVYSYGQHHRDTVELKDRMTQLRKDTLKAEKILYHKRGQY